LQFSSGKSRIAKDIAAIVNQAIADNGVRHYYEPFVGGCNIVPKVVCDYRYASDANQALVTLYRAWQDGWRPERVTEAGYARLKATKDPNDQYTAFAGFGMSFGGKWFGGWARQKGYDFFDGTVRGVDKRIGDCEDVSFLHCSYADLRIEPGSVVYCDPPYAGTTCAFGTEPFDTDAFLGWAERASGEGNVVFVSEYKIDRPGFREVWAKGLQAKMSGGTTSGAERTERLYRVFP
jgi:DNA adenine methylase